MNCPHKGCQGFLEAEGDKCSLCGRRVLFSHGRYRLERELKAGGMGKIYLIKDLHIEKFFVLKEMLSFADIPLSDKDSMVERFRREALILSRLQHGGLPHVSDFFIEENRYYIVMDYIQGKDLEEILNALFGDGMPEGVVIELALQICDILIYLHSQSPPVIHRDIKPANLIVCSKNNRVYLVDFGIARIMQSEMRGTAIGTPGYAPPEQFQGRLGIPSDVYSFGATLHHLLTGKDPRERDPFDFPLVSHWNPSVSSSMESLVNHCLKIPPEERVEDFIQLRRALEEIERKEEKEYEGILFSIREFINKEKDEEIENKIKEIGDRRTGGEKSGLSSPVSPSFIPDRSFFQSLDVDFYCDRDLPYLEFSLSHTWAEPLKIEKVIIRIHSRAFPDELVVQEHEPYKMFIYKDEGDKKFEIPLENKIGGFMKKCGMPEGVAIKFSLSASVVKGSPFEVPLSWTLNWFALPSFTDRIFLSLFYFYNSLFLRY